VPPFLILLYVENGSFFWIAFFIISLQCRLVVAQMTSTRSDGINTLLYLFVPIQIMSVYGLFMERTEFLLLILYNIIATLAHIHYGCCVVSEIINTKHKLIAFIGSANLLSS
jgi:hypothetical protein